MNQAYLHLLITHLPIFGSFLGALVLIHGIYTNTNQTKIAAYNIMLISCLGIFIAHETGEGAEELVEHISGFSKEAIEAHEEFSDIAMASFVILGIASLLGIIVTLKNYSFSKNIANAVLVIALISFIIVARTGYLGGKIRHSEIHAADTTITHDNDDD
jgi:uncharacterized membrane protein